MSNTCDKVEWTQKSKKIWHKDTQRLFAMKFHRVNIVDEYNNHMSNVEVADQLRGSYRFYIFLCKTKWWWYMFFWCFQMLLTNSYILYKKYLLLQNITPMSHYDFQNSVVKYWIRYDLHWPDSIRKRYQRGESNTQDNASVASSTRNNVRVSSQTLP